MRGYIFTLDALLAAIIVSAFLIMIHGYTVTYSDAGDNSMLNAASDIVSMLYSKGVLQTFDQATIERELNALLPPNLNISMTIYAYNPESVGQLLQCPTRLSDFAFVGCYDYDGDPRPGLVKYPPEADPRAQHCSLYPDQGGLDLDPGVGSSVVTLWCNDILLNSDCDFNDVVALFHIDPVAGGVRVVLDRDERWSAGHKVSIIVNGTFGGQNISLEAFNRDNQGYSESYLPCGEASPEQMVDINNELTGMYYSGKWAFQKMKGLRPDLYGLVLYRVWFK